MFWRKKKRTYMRLIFKGGAVQDVPVEKFTVTVGTNGGVRRLQWVGLEAQEATKLQDVHVDELVAVLSVWY